MMVLFPNGGKNRFQQLAIFFAVIFAFSAVVLSGYDGASQPRQSAIIAQGVTSIQLFSSEQAEDSIRLADLSTPRNAEQFLREFRTAYGKYQETARRVRQFPKTNRSSVAKEAILGDDAISVERLTEGIPPALVKEHADRIRLARVYLMTLVRNAYHLSALRVLEELYRTGDDEVRLGILNATTYAIDNDFWQREQYSGYRAFLKERIRDPRNPFRRAAMEALASQFVHEGDVDFVPQVFYPAADEGLKERITEKVQPYGGRGWTFLAARAKDRNQILSKAALRSIERAYHPGNPAEVKRKIEQFYRENPRLAPAGLTRLQDRFLNILAAAATTFDEDGSFDGSFKGYSQETAKEPANIPIVPTNPSQSIVQPPALREILPYIFPQQSVLQSPSPSPVPGTGAGTCELNHFREEIQWGSSNTDVVSAMNASAGHLPAALETDDFTGPYGFTLVVEGKRTVYEYGYAYYDPETGQIRSAADEWYAPTVRLNISLVETSKLLGTSLNTPANNPQKLFDGGLIIPAEEIERCIGKVTPLEPARWTNANPFPWPVRSPRWERNIEPKCGNGRKDKGEECGEPGLQCAPPPPGLRVECKKCRCIRSIGPLFGGSSRSEVSLGGGGEGGGGAAAGGTSFDELHVRPLPRSMLTQGPEELVWEGNWEGPLPPLARPGGVESFSCRILLKSADTAMRTKARIQVLEPTMRGQNYKDLLVPPDADGDGLPDSYETDYLRTRLNRQEPPYNACLAASFPGGVLDARRDADIGWWEFEGSRTADWTQAETGDGLSAWEEYRGMATADSFTETINGAPYRVIQAVSLMSTEPGTWGSASSVAHPEVKQLFVVDTSSRQVLPSLHGIQNPGVLDNMSVRKFLGVEPVKLEPNQMDPWSANESRSLGANLPSFGSLGGSVNFNRTDDPDQRLLGVVNGEDNYRAQPVLRIRDVAPDEEGRLREINIPLDAAMVTLVRNIRTYAAESFSMRDYTPRNNEISTPAGKALSLPILVFNSSIPSRLVPYVSRAAPENPEGHLKKVLEEQMIHEITHKITQAMHREENFPLTAAGPSSIVQHLDLQSWIDGRLPGVLPPQRGRIYVVELQESRFPNPDVFRYFIAVLTRIERLDASYAWNLETVPAEGQSAGRYVRTTDRGTNLRRLDVLDLHEISSFRGLLESFGIPAAGYPTPFRIQWQTFMQVIANGMARNFTTAEIPITGLGGFYVEAIQTVVNPGTVQIRSRPEYANVNVKRDYPPPP